MADPRLQQIMQDNPGISETDAARALVGAMGQMRDEPKPSFAQTMASWVNDKLGNVAGSAAYGVDRVVSPALNALGANVTPFNSIAEAQAKAKGMLPSTPAGVGAMGATMALSPLVAAALPAAPITAAAARTGIAAGAGTAGAYAGGAENPLAEGAKQGAYAATGELAGPVLRLFQAGLVRAKDAANLGEMIQGVIPAFKNNGTAQELFEIAKGTKGYAELARGFDQGQTIVEGLAGPGATVVSNGLNTALGRAPGTPMPLSEALSEVKKLGDRAFKSYGANTYDMRQAYRDAQDEITQSLPGPAATLYSAMRDKYSKGLEIMGLLNVPEAFIQGANTVKLNMQALQKSFGDDLAAFQKKGLDQLSDAIYRGAPVGSSDVTYKIPLRVHPKVGVPATASAHPGIGPTVFTGQPTGTWTPQSIVTPAAQAVGNAVSP